MSRRRGVVAAYILLVLQVVVSLAFTPLLIRSLGQAEYGLYSLVSSITAYFLLLDAGVGNALIRYVAKFRVTGEVDQQRRLLGVSLIFYAGVAVAILTLGVILRSNLSGIFGTGLTTAEISRLGILLNITLVSAGVMLIASAFDRTIIAYEHFVFSKSMSISQLLVRVVILTVLLLSGYRALAVVTVNLILTVVFGAISAAYVLFRLELRPVFSGMPVAFVREVLGYSTFVMIQMVATQLNFMSNQVILGIMTSSIAIGIYAVGAQLVQYFQSIASSINGVLMPGVVRMVENHATPDVILGEVVKVGRLLFMVLGLILVTFALIGRSFVSLWAGPENVQAYWVALLMMIPLAFSLTQSILSQVLWAKDKHRVQALLQIAVAITNIALTVVLIRVWRPAEGAAMATAIAYVLGDVVVLNVLFSRTTGVSMWRYYDGLFKGIVPCLLIGLAAGGAIRLLGVTGWQGVIVQSVTVMLVYALTMRAFGMNAYERGLICSLLGRSSAAA